MVRKVFEASEVVDVACVESRVPCALSRDDRRIDASVSSRAVTIERQRSKLAQARCK